MRGTVVAPADAGYDECRKVWNAMIDRRPGLVARCLGVGDVVSCVRFAKEHGVELSVKGGGHSIAGLAVGEGLMIDMSLMRGVWVDPSARVAHAQPGCLLGDVDRETQLHGLAAVLGFVSQTGIAGLTLGGGFGYLTRRFGWTTDTVRSIEVVTAEGRIVRASEKTHADLFWALRGGGGNFGVATDFEYTLYPVGPEIVGGAIAWQADAAEEVLEMYRSLVSTAAPELTCVAALRAAPPAPWLPKDVHGQPIVALFVCHSGSAEQGEKVVAALKSFGKPLGNTLQRRPYVSQQSLLDATQPAGRRYYWKSEYLPRIDSEFLHAVAKHASRLVSPHSAILIFPLDGALNRLPTDHSAVGNRDAACVFNIASAWDHAKDDRANIEWARAGWADLKRFSTGGTYVNFLTEEEDDVRVRAAYGENHTRLVNVKTTWDPGNMFRVNKNIAPR
jgi:FAD/FMN-containing dehydrogenase